MAGRVLPAALVMTNLQAALRTALDFCPDPAKAMSHVSRHMEQHMSLGYFVTLFLGLLEPRSGRMDYVNAGHVLPMLTADGKVVPLGSPRNMPLGIFGPDYVADSVTLSPGTVVVLVLRQVSLSGEQWMRLLGIIGMAKKMDVFPLVLLK